MVIKGTFADGSVMRDPNYARDNRGPAPEPPGPPPAPGARPAPRPATSIIWMREV